MALMIFGLLLFLGVHSVRITSDGWRNARVQQFGLMPWKGIYSLVSLLGFAMLCWGFAQARVASAVLWTPPAGMRHLTALLVLIAFIMLAAAYVPGNQIRARLHHPMVLSVKVWAAAHLLANGRLVDIVLFGSFLLWAVLDFRSLRQRDLAAQTVYPAGKANATVLTVVIGVVAWVVFAFWLHALLIGVQPMQG